MSIGCSTCITILVGSGRLKGRTADSPNGKPNDSGTTLVRAAAGVRSERLASPAAGEVELRFLPADGRPWVRWERRLDRGLHVTLAAVEVDLVLRDGR